MNKIIQTTRVTNISQTCSTKDKGEAVGRRQEHDNTYGSGDKYNKS